jgi:XTP/dITP diphosphohydrolase
MKRLYIATGNLHKFQEFLALDRLHPCGFELRAATDLGGMPAVDENTGTFSGNANIKAKALHAIAPKGSWVVADDSGLCVEALNGAPGVDSAIYAGRGAGDRANLEKMLQLLEETADPVRIARFFCILIALGPSSKPLASTGMCTGTLRREPAGGGGFGYDPVFVPEGWQCTLSEAAEAEKNKVSHRARAWRLLAARLREVAE